jgi:hypothetical protein
MPASSNVSLILHQATWFSWWCEFLSLHCTPWTTLVHSWLLLMPCLRFRFSHLHWEFKHPLLGVSKTLSIISVRNNWWVDPRRLTGIIIMPLFAMRIERSSFAHTCSSRATRLHILYCIKYWEGGPQRDMLNHCWINVDGFIFLSSRSYLLDISHASFTNMAI